MIKFTPIKARSSFSFRRNAFPFCVAYKFYWHRIFSNTHWMGFIKLSVAVLQPPNTLHYIWKEKKNLNWLKLEWKVQTCYQLHTIQTKLKTEIYLQFEKHQGLLFIEVFFFHLLFGSMCFAVLPCLWGLTVGVLGLVDGSGSASFLSSAIKLYIYKHITNKTIN